MEIDRALRDRVQVAAELALERALERAGNRLKGRAGILRDTLRHVPAVEAVMVAGPTLIADAGLDPQQLLAGAWDDLVVKYQTWANTATDEALGVMGTLVGEWRTGYVEAMKHTLTDHLSDSAQYLEDALNGIAVESMFDPKAVLFRTGADVIPTGFVRHVLARAGGTADISDSGYAFVALRANGDPIPGLATGPVMLGALKDHGGTVEAFRWVYGPARRREPFRPHQDLDGKVFAKFTDPVLTNTHPWPPGEFFLPGDHAHCRCDFEPVVLSNEQAQALGLKTLTPEPVAAPEVPVVPGEPAPKAKVERAPLSPLGRAPKGVPKLADAAKAVRKNSVRTTEFGFDGGDVERLAVGTRQVKLKGGGIGDSGDFTEYRMKLTDGGSRRWRERLTANSPEWRRAEQQYLDQSVTNPLRTDSFDFGGRDRGLQWQQNGWTATRGADFQDIRLNGRKAPAIDLDKGYVSPSGGYFRFTDGSSTFAKNLTVDGRRVRVEFTDAALNGGPFALKNQVKVFVEGGAADERLFHAVMKELDLVSDVRYPAPVDVRKYTEDALLTRLAKKRPYLMTATERTAELRRITAEYGIGPKDLELHLGPNGQIAAELSDAGVQTLVDRTGVTWFHHQLSFSGDAVDSLLNIIGSGEDGLAATTRRFNDGVGGFGMSSSSDVRTGGGDFVFTRQQHYGDLALDRTGLGQVTIRNSALKRMDWFAYESDKFGVVSDALSKDYGATYGSHDFVSALANGKAGSQETMFRGVIDWSDVEAIGVGDAKTKLRLIEELKARGITKLGDRDVADVLTFPGEAAGQIRYPHVLPAKLYPGGIATKIAQHVELSVDDLAQLVIQQDTGAKIPKALGQLDGMTFANLGDGSNFAKMKNFYVENLPDALTDPLKTGLPGADAILAEVGWDWNALTKALTSGWDVEMKQALGDELANLLQLTKAMADPAVTTYGGKTIYKAAEQTQDNLNYLLGSLKKNVAKSGVAWS